MEDVSCFSRLLIPSSDWQEDLDQCRASISQQSSNYVWGLLGNDVEAVRDKLVEWMELYSTEPVRAWTAAKTYCDIVNVPGSDAYRACDRKSLRSLLSMMKKAFASQNNGGDFQEGKRKKRRHELSEEEREDWAVFFRTISRASDNLDLEETCDALVHLGMRILSDEVIELFQNLGSSSRKKRVGLLRTLLHETLHSIHTNDLSKDSLSWIASALRAISQVDRDLCLAFTQRVCDNCEPTTQAVRTRVVELVQMCLLNEEVDIKTSLEKFCAAALVRADKASKRSLGCELVATLMASDSVVQNDNDSVVETLAFVVRDPVPSVRCSALRAIAMLAGNKPFILLAKDEILLRSAIEAASLDDKAGVRRWAVKAVSLCPAMHEQALETCVERCRDVALSVRKVAVEAVGGFMQRYSHAAKSAFCDAVLPLVRDEEKSVVDASLGIIATSLFSCGGGMDSNAALHKSVLPLLYTVRTESQSEFLSVALRELGQKQEMSTIFREFVYAVTMEALVSLPTENEAKRLSLWSSWLILEKCAEINKLPPNKVLSGEFLLGAWSQIGRLLTLSADDQDEEQGTMEAHLLQKRVLNVISASLDRIAVQQRRDLGNDLLRDLAELERPPEVVSSMIHLLQEISKLEEKERPEAVRANDLIADWGLALKTACEQWLGQVSSSSSTTTSGVSVGNDALNNNNTDQQQQQQQQQQMASYSKTECAIFLIGELAMIGFNFDDKTSGRIVPFYGRDEDPSVVLVQAMASPDIAKSHVTRAFALVALGKLCMRDEVLAKRCAPVFVRELSLSSKSFNYSTQEHGQKEIAAVKVNCLVVLGDLCRRYTNVVEPFVERISKSLGDMAAIVRKRCLLVLAGLLQEEYIRIRPYLFFRLLACAADESKDVAQAAAFVLTRSLLARIPTLFQSHAATVVFAMNGLPRYLSRGGGESSAADAEDVPSLVGIQARRLNQNVDARMSLYKLVLSKLDDAQKLEMCNRLRRDVLGGLLEGTIALEQFETNDTEDDLSAVTTTVLDSFVILESEFSRPAVLGGGGSGSKVVVNEEGEESQEDMAISRATAKIIDALERKNISENVIPLLASLYTVACKARSSLVKLVLDHIKLLYQRYRQECSSALAPYRDLHSLIQMELGLLNGRGSKEMTKKKSQTLKEITPTEINESTKEDQEKDAKSTLVQKEAVEISINAKEELTRAKTPKVLRRARAALMIN